MQQQPQPQQQHQCAALPYDVLEHIFTFLDVEADSTARKPLYSALLSSKLIYEVAVKSLWRYLSSPGPLVRLLPCVKLVGDRYVIDDTYPDSDSPSYWAPFTTHAKLVHKLDYITFQLQSSEPSIDPSIFEQILLRRPETSSTTTNLFTRLTDFQLLFKQTPIPAQLLMFMAPGVERIEVHSINEYDPPDRRTYLIDEYVRVLTGRGGASTLSSLSSSSSSSPAPIPIPCPHLKHLTLPRPASSSSLYSLSRLANLESLTIMWPSNAHANANSSTLDMHALSQIGSLPQLKHLDIDFSCLPINQTYAPFSLQSYTSADGESLININPGSEDNKDTTINPLPLPLPSLLSLTIKSYIPLVHRFLESLSSPNLKKIKILAVLGDLRDWRDVFEVIGEKWAGRVERLSATDMHVRHHDGVRSSSRGEGHEIGAGTRSKPTPTSILPLLFPLASLSTNLRSLVLSGFPPLASPHEEIVKLISFWPRLEELGLPVPEYRDRGMRGMGRFGYGYGYGHRNSYRNSNMAMAGYETLLKIREGLAELRVLGCGIELGMEGSRSLGALYELEMEMGLRLGSLERLGMLEGEGGMREPVWVGSESERDRDRDRDRSSESSAGAETRTGMRSGTDSDNNGNGDGTGTGSGTSNNNASGSGNATGTGSPRTSKSFRYGTYCPHVQPPPLYRLFQDFQEEAQALRQPSKSGSGSGSGSGAENRNRNGNAEKSRRKDKGKGKVQGKRRREEPTPTVEPQTFHPLTVLSLGPGSSSNGLWSFYSSSPSSSLSSRRRSAIHGNVHSLTIGEQALAERWLEYLNPLFPALERVGFGGVAQLALDVGEGIGKGKGKESSRESTPDWLDGLDYGDEDEDEDDS
ncbi:hypothetical protein D9758_013918 [Tetrapyrgos nigripes]|uniref:F-box domain-containing protein n=1 Tax=Tetrapyrgos nigripes TaxID=182062 RepID=A0A8H5FPQ0_9AGAR|nr:hypothetical protein D9758_013918 [Tetrapyrgos nigripes]